MLIKKMSCRDNVMKSTKKNLTRMVIFASIMTSSALAHAFTLEDAVHKTLVSHPDILSAKSEEQAADHDVYEAKGGLLPSLNIEGAIGREQSDNSATRSTNAARAARAGKTTSDHTVTLTRKESEVGVRQLLFDGGNITNEVRVRRAVLHRSQFQVDVTQARLATEAATSYLEIMRNKALVNIAKRDVEAHRDTLAKVTKRLQAGAGRRSEINLVESRLALSQSRLENARGDLDDANDRYIKVVGSRAPAYLKNPILPTTPRNLREAQMVAMQRNPTIAALGAEYDATHFAVQSAKAAYYPTFVADLAGTFSNDLDGVKGHNNDAQAMLRMTYNIFRGGSDKAAIDAARSRRMAARHDIDNTRRDIGEDVAFAWNALQAAKGSIPYLQAHRDASLSVYQAYQKQFQLGQRTLFDLLNANTEYYDAKRTLVQGLYDKKVSVYRLIGSIGILPNTLDSMHHGKAQPKPADHVKALQTGPLSSATHPTEVKVAQRTTPAATNSPRVATMQSKLSTADNTHFTLQVMAAKNPQTLQHFIYQNHLQAKASYYHAKVNGHDWYRLVYGDYPTYGAARAGMDHLPTSLGQVKPMVRSFANVQRSIDSGKEHHVG